MHSLNYVWVHSHHLTCLKKLKGPCSLVKAMDRFHLLGHAQLDLCAPGVRIDVKVSVTRHSTVSLTLTSNLEVI